MARVAAAPVSIVTLTYVAPLDAVDAQMKAHVAWLEQAVDAGLLLVAGRQVPRVGGVVVFRGHRAEVEALVASDPFITSGVATAEVVEIAASFAADEVAALLA